MRFVQSFRNQIDIEIFKNNFIQVESDTINIQNNVNIFSKIITTKSELRFKNNYKISIINVQKSKNDVFFKFAAFATIANKINILQNKTLNIKNKTTVFNKQTRNYNKIADNLQTFFDDSKFNKKKLKNSLNKKKTSLKKIKITYIDDSIPLTQKKFNRFIKNYKNYLIFIAIKLKDKITILVNYVHRTKKRLKNVTQLKIAINFKLFRNIKLYKHFKITI